ncbi:MAG: polyprenyl synthetase family protein [Phycisphaerales bacterium JB040]
MLDVPDNLAPVQSALFDALRDVEGVFDAELESELTPVSDLCAHVERYRGKMLRPTLVLACGLATHERAGDTGDWSGLITPDHRTLGAVCEMVHMATLVHDDVLDEADVRRRGQTLNTLRGNEEAVILGDYLIASAYHLCSSLPTTGPSRAIGETSRAMCAGELLQLHNRNNWSLDEQTYLEILRGKTGALIATACRLGAEASGAPVALAEAVWAYGMRLGVAFQVQDDLLDLTGDEATVGKSVRKDLDKGKLTYPLIHHLSTAPARERGVSLELIERATRGKSDDAVRRLIDAIRTTGSLEASRELASGEVALAKEAIGVLPGSAARELLLLMADAVIERAF